MHATSVIVQTYTNIILYTSYHFIDATQLISIKWHSKYTLL